MFVKAGSILPLLLMKKKRISLLQSINDPVSIEVYPTSNGGEIYGLASGNMYLDEGSDTTYASHKTQTLVKFRYEYTANIGMLSVTKQLPDDYQFSRAGRKKIVEVTVYDVYREPTSVENSYAMGGYVETGPQGTVLTKFTYD
jgi:hypothetical protein